MNDGCLRTLKWKKKTGRNNTKRDIYQHNTRQDNTTPRSLIPRKGTKYWRPFTSSLSFLTVVAKTVIALHTCTYRDVNTLIYMLLMWRNRLRDSRRWETMRNRGERSPLMTPGAADTTAGRTLSLQFIIFIISRCVSLSLWIRVHSKSWVV